MNLPGNISSVTKKVELDICSESVETCHNVIQVFLSVIILPVCSN